MAVILDENNEAKLITATKGEELIAPSSVHWEIGNAFSAVLKRRKNDINLAKKAVEYYFQLPLRLVDVDIVNRLFLQIFGL